MILCALTIGTFVNYGELVKVLMM